jgi:NAD(P)-dependent dehydrogenase (short-subunit alcohol dehydrogenase family)
MPNFPGPSLIAYHFKVAFSSSASGRDQKTLDEALAELGPNARGYRADVTIAEDRKRLFAALAKDFGKLDIVFANAGITGR